MGGVTETLVIGASAAGLATAAELRKRGRKFEIVESEGAVAGPWRRHYDRLHLHTPKSLSALPGLAMPKGWPRYPARDQVVEYLERYRVHFDLQPHFSETVSCGTGGRDVGIDHEQWGVALRQRCARYRSHQSPGSTGVAGSGAVPG